MKIRFYLSTLFLIVTAIAVLSAIAFQKARIRLSSENIAYVLRNREILAYESKSAKYHWFNRIAGPTNDITGVAFYGELPSHEDLEKLLAPNTVTWIQMVAVDLDDETAKAITRHLSHLLEVNLIDTTVSDNGLRLLAQAGPVNALTLQDALSNDNARAVGFYPELETLVISYTKDVISKQSFEYFDLPRLKCLWLDNVKVAPGALESLPILQGLDELFYEPPNECGSENSNWLIRQPVRKLILNGINSETSPPKFLIGLNSAVRSLDFRNCRITESDIKVLMQLPALEELNVDSSNIDENIAAQLREWTSKLPASGKSVTHFRKSKSNGTGAQSEKE